MVLDQYGKFHLNYICTFIHYIACIIGIFRRIVNSVIPFDFLKISLLVFYTHLHFSIFISLSFLIEFPDFPISIKTRVPYSSLFVHGEDEGPLHLSVHIQPSQICCLKRLPFPQQGVLIPCQK